MKKETEARSRRQRKVAYRHEDLKSSLLQEALLFLKNNAAKDLSLRELARRLDVSHMAPYRHFSNKEELLAEIVERGFKSLSRMFDTARTTAPASFPALFKAYGKAYISFVMEHPDQARLMFSGLICEPKKYQSAHEAGQKTFMRLFELMTWGQETGHVEKKDDPFMLSLMVWSAVHGSSMLMIENQFAMIDNAPEVQLEKYVDFMAEKILKGLL